MNALWWGYPKLKFLDSHFLTEKTGRLSVFGQFPTVFGGRYGYFTEINGRGHHGRYHS